MLFSGLKITHLLPGLASLKRAFHYLGMVTTAHPVCLFSSLGLGVVFLPECRYKDLDHVSLANQDNSKRGLLLDENVPGCSAGLSHMTQQAAGSFLTGSTTQQLSFSDLSDTWSSRGTGSCQRSVGLWWLAKPLERLSPNLVEGSTVIRTSNYHQVYS